MESVDDLWIPKPKHVQLGKNFIHLRVILNLTSLKFIFRCAAYMAPERIDPKKPEYDIRADVWSLGITLVELATGAYPYKDCKTDFEVLTKVLDSDPPSLPENQGFSDEFRDFVKGCLTKDYRQRPKYLQLLQHPFLKYIGSFSVDVVDWLHRTTREAGIILPTQDLPQTSSIAIAPSSSSTSLLNR